MVLRLGATQALATPGTETVRAHTTDAQQSAHYMQMLVALKQQKIATLVLPRHMHQITA